ncbi:MAG: transglycosylase domain-containing protein [Sporichthyaceae bacterium]|nr:transglycosylase domain-containing protein [Sporichthyaceae bacterium]
MKRPWNRTEQGFIQHIPVFIVASVAAGGLVAALVVPFVGAAGMAAKAASSHFQDLPTELKLPLLPTSSRILDKNGKQIATFFSENRLSVTLDKIAPVMRQAVVAIEDERFYEHNGVDLRSVSRAFFTNLSTGAVEEGASTLTMQYVRNILIEQAGDDDEKLGAAKEETSARKIQEIRYATELERQLSKDQILEGYLNTVYFGAGTYGVEAAARHYFSVRASKLTLGQAALLAGILPAPAVYDPTDRDNLPLAKARRDLVLDRMADLGMISREEAEKTMKSRIRLKVSKVKNGCYSTSYPLFCDYVMRILKKDKAFGKTPEARLALLERGGLTIRTTLDPKAQKAAQKSINNYVYTVDEVAAAIAMVEPGSGAVRAIAQSRPFGYDGKKGQNAVNYAVDYAYGNSRGFQTGSTMKAFTTAAAFAEGFRGDHAIMSPFHLPASRLDIERDCAGNRVFPKEDGVVNFAEFENGMYTLRTGLEMSVNTYFTQLTDQVGLCNVVKMAKRAGIHRADGNKLDEVYSFTLGVNEISPLTMANAYATFAARGIHCDTFAIMSVTDRFGEKLAVPKSECERVITPGVADATTSLLTNVMTNGTGAGVQLSGRPSAGKTGTAQELSALWFVGYTPQLASAVWAGNPDTNDYPMRNRTVGGTFYRSACSGCLPGPIWRDAMNGALSGVKVRNFVAPDRKYLYGSKIEIPDLKGMRLDEAIDALRAVGLEGVEGDQQVPSGERKGRVAITDPPAGTEVGSGSTVTIYLSNGQGGDFEIDLPPPPELGTGGGGGDNGNDRGRKPRQFF